MNGIAIVAVLIVAGAAAAWMFVGGSPSTLSGNAGMEQPGASGLPERIFFALFGAPRDRDKEQQLSWRRRPVPPVPAQLPGTGFSGRGASRRW